MFKPGHDEQQQTQRERRQGVLGLSNSWSPTSRVTICTVTGGHAVRGFMVRLALRPAAMTTIMVSPIARDRQQTPPMMPGSGRQDHLADGLRSRRTRAYSRIAQRLRHRR